MIKYKLICKNCDLSFDSWFSSSVEYDRLKKKNYINCHSCNSLKVEKSLMSPGLINIKKTSETLENKRQKKIKKTLREYQKFIRKNFEYVGKNFAFEARSVHYNNKKKEKGIYGLTSNKELKELREEGIVAETIPWVEDKDN